MIKEIVDFTPALLGIIAVAGVFFEISPIKINPISWICKWAGERMNSGTMARLDTFEKELEAMRNQTDKSRIKTLRFEILDFSDSIRTGRKHSKNAFEHIMESHDEYLCLLDKHNMTNGVTDEAYKYVTDVYRECLRENKFI